MALVFKDIILDLSKVSEEDKATVKDKVADLLYNEVLRHVSTGNSPVQGEQAFKQLNKKYAKREKQGRRTANLQLEGDLLRDDFATKVLDEGDVIRIGHFKESTAKTEGEKADGHNQHSAKAQAWALSKPFPKRRYIPNEAQTFKGDIMDKVQNLVDKYSRSDLDLAADAVNAVLRDGGKTTTVKETTQTTEIGLSDYLSDDYLAQLIGDRLDL